MTGATATRREKRADGSGVEARHERVLRRQKVRPSSSEVEAVNGKDHRVAGQVLSAANQPTDGDAATEKHLTEEDARLLGTYNLYNG
ncbi:MAG: hypothetical protein K0R41_2081 [Geminicoccaceae bacterium]|jgi:hypothetical protein|nr:hypothetical protein [Geminicoccaceae bacterium]